MTAIVLLALFRIGQGLALGGSWDGLPSLLALNAPQDRRGWYAMMRQLGAPLGFRWPPRLFAYLYASLSSRTISCDWGWRYPFFVAFAINVVALFARLRLVVTPEYERSCSTRANSSPATCRELTALAGPQRRDRRLRRAGELRAVPPGHRVPAVLDHCCIRRSRSAQFLVIQIIGAVLAAGGIVASGVIADRIGRRRTLGAAGDR